MPPLKAARVIVFIVDEDCGPHVAAGIRDAGGHAKLLTDLVPSGTLDVDWIPRLAEWGDALVTRDVAMRTNPAEMEALTNSGVHVFILRAGGMKFAELRAVMEKHFAPMARYVKNDGTPFLARITKSGVEVINTSGRRSAKKRA